MPKLINIKPISINTDSYGNHFEIEGELWVNPAYVVSVSADDEYKYTWIQYLCGSTVRNARTKIHIAEVINLLQAT